MSENSSNGSSFPWKFLIGVGALFFLLSEMGTAGFDTLGDITAKPLSSGAQDSVIFTQKCSGPLCKNSVTVEQAHTGQTQAPQAMKSVSNNVSDSVVTESSEDYMFPILGALAIPVVAILLLVGIFSHRSD